MAINLEEILPPMIAAAKSTLNDNWPNAKDCAVSELKKIGENIIKVESLVVQEKISKETAQLHLEIQKNSTRNVLLSIDGVGLLLADQVIETSLSAVREIVNSAFGTSFL